MKSVSLVALAIVGIGWFGYPAVVALLARWRSRLPASNGQPNRTVSVVIATRDEPEVVSRRVTNILETDYPRDHLQVVVAVDPTSSYAVERYRVLLGDKTRVVVGHDPGGKAATLNAGVEAAIGQLLVFADSQQTFAPDAIPRLVRYLDDERFGAVSGGYDSASEGTETTVLGLFWKLELVLRRGEAVLHSIVAVTGAIYCMRRSLWTPLPPHLICDDLFVPLEVVRKGYRVGFCQEARAHDPRHFTKREEFRRKVRTLTGMLQLCVWRPGILLPWKNPIWIQFVCHKLLRVATPYLLIIGAVGLVGWLGGMPKYWMLVGGLLGLLGALVFRVLKPTLAKRLGSQMTWAVKLQGAPIQATLNALRGRWDVW